MGQLNISYLKKYAGACSVFVETGTYQGQTLELAMTHGFKTLHSIEIDEKFFNVCLGKFKSHAQVILHHGDSPDILTTLMPQIVEPCVFWLDAHRSTLLNAPGSPTYGPCPLLQELDAIATSALKNHVIFIDDCRLFDQPNWNFLSRQQVLSRLMTINPDYKIEYLDGETSFGIKNPVDDILVAYPCESH